MSEILANVNKNGVATLTLNNPKALNSITLNMVQLMKNQFKKWENDDQVHIIILEGAGDKAFSAGGDIKSLYTANVDEAVKRDATQFFKEEYELDAYLAQYSKPILANLDGIIMGGGVGLAYHADYRIVSERTKWAMPEMNLGFFPDVGAGHFLNKAPSHIGRYLALTGNIINGSEAKYIQAADYLIQSESIPLLIDKINTTNWNEKELGTTLKAWLESEHQSKLVHNHLANHETAIKKHFDYHTIEEIIASLSKDTSEFASETKAIIEAKSAVSVKVALEQLIRYKNLTLEDALQMDKIVAINFLNNEDFYEGVRAVLIDKDKQPHYHYDTFDKVSETLVDSFFRIN